MKTNIIVTVIAAMFFVLMISGCSGSTDSASNAKIDGIEWKLESLNGKPVTLNSGKFITLTLNKDSQQSKRKFKRLWRMQLVLWQVF